ncbi:MAG: transketolase [Nitrospirae bacterium]|nr:transketolase [Nitrospirota bacterium]
MKLNRQDKLTLKDKALEVRRETLRIHGTAQGTRIASSLSPVEIFVVLYYGKILAYDPANPQWPGRDRLIVSKGHGSICLYPILGDLGFFDRRQLDIVCQKDAILGAIPDPHVPGYETINGSLGHGLGVACGMAIALRAQRRPQKVFAILGDGEMSEGSVWEAIMFAGHHRLDNLIFIVDNNKACMLDFCKNVIDIEPIEKKIKPFGWTVKRVDGHDIGKLHAALSAFKDQSTGKPIFLLADTIKGKGVAELETDPMSHTRNIHPGDIEAVIGRLK